jgi:predicted double-glycine peptidase
MTKLLNVKPFRQSSGHCGAACLKIVLGYYGIQKSERELIKLVGSTTASGVSTENMALAIKKYKIHTIIKDNSNLKQIASLLAKQIPIMVDWFSDNDGHYSVVVGLDRENIYMQDPELGHLRTMKRKAFMTVWFDFEGPYLVDKDDIIIRRMIIIQPKKKDIRK